MTASAKRRIAQIGLAIVAALLLWRCSFTMDETGRREKILSQEKIIAFTYLPPREKFDPKALRSVTFILAHPNEWKYWLDRGVIPAVGQTWFALLNPHSRENGKPVWSLEQAVNVLLNLDYGSNPNPVVCIDEFGFDFGGETDQKIAEILAETKRRKPELGIAVWQMRGPIPQVLAEAYRKYVDLVLMECYVGEKKDYWWIVTQVHAARIHGLIKKSIVALGLGVGGYPGELWARTKDELEQQIRFVRLIAPESQGIGFFAPGATPELLACADELCGRFFQIPTDGSGLPEDVIELHQTFSKRHKKPTLVCSPLWVEPNRSRADPNVLVEPKTMRVYLMNLGDKDAKDVKVRLRNPEEKGGDVFAEGVVGVIPRRYEAIAVLQVIGEWKVWKTWELEVEARGCEVLKFTFGK